MTFQDQLRTLLADARSAVASAKDSAALRTVDVTFLGRKGRFATLARAVADAPAADRPAMGKALNDAKRELSVLLGDARTRMEGGAMTPAIDPTVPGVRPRRGSLHPVTQMLERVWDVFSGMGYALVDGPDVELDQYNFQALNMPPTHPARDM
ncbi:MAG: phenylalanine--tRNA ligase subunit alpha, partial [Candidatus Kerfeldbacteria bacterium]|nr:phenylalanine--tRNA ligase subunit alpha [Candidatus Kerfeldbacteria bacterium]